MKLPVNMESSTSTGSAGFDIPLQLLGGLNNNKATVLAPWLYGAIIASVCVGILLMQAGLYYARYPKDRLYYKVTVALLTLLSLVTWSSTLAILNHAFIEGFGSVLAMHAWTQASFVVIAVPAFAGTISQSFFATRVYRLSGQKRWLGVLLLFLVLTSFVAGLVCIAVEPHTSPIPLNGNDVLLFELIDQTVRASFLKVITSVQVFLWTQAATDVVISACLIIYLVGERRKNDKQMGTTLTKVLVLGLTTAGVTAVYSVAEGVIVFTTVWSNNVNMFLTLSLTHVYSLVTISSLNVRRAINPRRRTVSEGSGPAMSQFSGHAPRPSMASAYTYHSKGASPIEGPTPASLIKAAATLPINPPFGNMSPCRPPPSVLRIDTDLVGRPPARDRFDSAHSLESASKAALSPDSPPVPLPPQEYLSRFPVLKGDGGLVVPPRFSYLRPAVAPPYVRPSVAASVAESPRRPRPKYKNDTPA